MISMGFLGSSLSTVSIIFYLLFSSELMGRVFLSHQSLDRRAVKRKVLNFVSTNIVITHFYLDECNQVTRLSPCHMLLKCDVNQGKA